MTRRPTSFAGRLSLLLAASAAACASHGAVGGHDAAADATGAHGPDAGDAGDARSDRTVPDAGREGGPDARRETGADATGEASVDGHADAPADSPVDARRDAAVDAGYDAGPPALRYIGRTLTDGTSPDGNGACTPTTPCFEWSGTQVVARVSGATSVSLTMSDYGSYFDVYVDGALQPGGPLVGSPSQADYAVATGLDPSTTHEVSLCKRTEASSSGRTMIQGVTLPGGGALLAPAEPAPRRIEVIGDSISCGYGVLGPDATCTETPALEDSDDSYATLTARSLGADLYTIASSGRGVATNIDGTTTGTVPEIYSLALPYGGAGLWSSPWTFAAWTPDAVVIDLGTNDMLAAGDAGRPFQGAYLALLQTVRAHYPGAYILCTNGPILAGAQYSQAQAYIEGAITSMHDARVGFLGFGTQAAANGAGCDQHPSITTHQLMAAQLTSALEAALGW